MERKPTVVGVGLPPHKPSNRNAIIATNETSPEKSDAGKILFPIVAHCEHATAEDAALKILRFGRIYFAVKETRRGQVESVIDATLSPLAIQARSGWGAAYEGCALSVSALIISAAARGRRLISTGSKSAVNYSFTLAAQAHPARLG